MALEAHPNSHNRLRISAGLLFILVVLIYSNTFRASWHLDDYQQITHNPRIQIDDLSLSSLKQSMVAPHGKNINRPLARISLALNWYAGEDNPVGYHMVNILIHFLASVFLYLTVLALFQTPRLRSTAGDEAHFVALLAAALWAAHPIQTQAVTYIVQRMASMAAMFYILGLYLYLRARLAEGSTVRRGVLFSACILSFAAGVASKENAAMLPLAVFLLEMMFFQDLSSSRTRKILLAGVLGGMVLVTVGGLIFFRHSNPMEILTQSDFRDYTPLERLLTQSRIVIFYISQIAYPVPNRLSIEHDVILSTGLLEPWTTLPSILIILGLIGLGVWQMRRRPLLSYAILFFFLNHGVESTILSLELVFEHRNYLPSMFLFVPVAAGFYRLVSYYRPVNRRMHVGLVAFGALLILGMGMGTYLRNLTWGTPKTLWEDAMTKAPHSHRPLHNLAWAYYEKIGDDGTAMSLYQKALRMDKNNRVQQSLTLNNIASIYYKHGDYRRAAEHWQAAVDDYPRFKVGFYRCALAFYRAGDRARALDYLDRILTSEPNSRDALNLKGKISLSNGSVSEALACFKKVVQLSPRNAQALLNLGAAFNLAGDYRKAKLILKTALAEDPGNRLIMVWLVDTGIRSNDPEDTRRYLEKLLATAPVQQINGLLNGSHGDQTVGLPEDSGVAQAVAQALNRIAVTNH
jgi:tetratricopeptide (TPR) repeat protein